MCMGCGNKLLAGATGIAKAAANAIGIPVEDIAEPQEIASRRAICTGCDKRMFPPRREGEMQWLSSLCGECKCVLFIKTQIASEACPLGKWPAIPPKEKA